MASWRCGSCGLFNFADSTSCRRCGTDNNAGASFSPQPQPSDPYAQPSTNPTPYTSPYQQPPYGQQQSYGQQPYPVQDWNAGQSSWGNSQATWNQPPNPTPPPDWNAPQAPANGYQPYTGYPSQSTPDYSQAPSYGAPSAGIYQPTFPMMNNWNQGGVWREGDKLVMHKHATLPDRCIKCNVPTGGLYLHRKLSWINPLWGLLILISWIIYLVIYFALRKTAEVDMALCAAHRSNRQMSMTVGWLTAVLGVAAFVFAIANSAIVFVIFGILLLLGGILWASSAAAVVSVTKIDDQYIWMKRVNKDFLASFPPSSGY